jgi:acetylcholinesterase
VTHASDLPYLFGNNATSFPKLGTPSAETLSEQMMDYWISFTATGQPNGDSGSLRAFSFALLFAMNSDVLRLDDAGPVWEQYTSDENNVIQLNGSVSKMIGDDWREDRIGYMSEDPVVWHR